MQGEMMQSESNRPATGPASRPDADLDHLEWGNLRQWAELVRLPNVFTLFSDCIVAAVVAVGTFWPLTAMLPIVAASLCAYWAGMILNDVVDLDEDREFRPHRPLASKAISPVIAGHVATGMLLVGPIFVLAAMTFHTTHALWMGAAFLASVLLSLSVRLYDSPVKRTLLGPPLMGLCRALNILMVGTAMFAVSAGRPASDLQLDSPPERVAGQPSAQLNAEFAAANPSAPAESITAESITAESITAESITAESITTGLVEPKYPLALLALALGIGTYIFGVTVYARREEQDSHVTGLVLGVSLEAVGLLIIGFLPRWAEPGQLWTLNPAQGYPLLIGLIGLTVVNRGVSGIVHPVPRKVQLAVRHAILTLILIDAAVVLMWAGAWYGCATVALLLPALSSAIRFRST